jgi:hypothetical protein
MVKLRNSQMALWMWKETKDVSQVSPIFLTKLLSVSPAEKDDMLWMATCLKGLAASCTKQ